MGAGASWPAQVVEISVGHPTVLPGRDTALGTSLFAQVHTEAGGTVKLPGWGEAHLVGLCEDDVITLSVYAAESEAEFEAHRRQNFAQVHLPWVDVREAVQQGEETLILGLEPNTAWLGQSAGLADYREAFRRAGDLAMSDAATPHVRIAIRSRELKSLDPELRRLAASQNKAGAAPDAESSAGFSVPRRSQLQQANRRRDTSPASSASHPVEREISGLCSSVASSCSQGWSVSEAPSPGGGMGAGPRGRQAERLRQALFRNYALKTELNTVMKEMEVFNAGDQNFVSSEDQRTSLDSTTTSVRLSLAESITSGASPHVPHSQRPSSPGPSDRASLDSNGGSQLLECSPADDAEIERQRATYMLEIQDVSDSILELMGRYDGQIVALQQELVATKLRASLTKEQARQHVLQQANRNFRAADTAATSIPMPQLGTAALQASVGQLQGQLAHLVAKQPSTGLAGAAGGQALDRALSERQAMEQEVETLQSAAYSSEASRREYEDLLLIQRALGKELESAQRAVDSLDHKISRLRDVNGTLKRHTRSPSEAAQPQVLRQDTPGSHWVVPVAG